MFSRRQVSVRSRCGELLDELGIRSSSDQQFSLADLGQRVQDVRGRPLHLLSILTGPGWPSGLWFESASADYVLFDGATSPLHQADIVAHEFGHILLRHGGAAVRPEMAPMFRRLRADPATPVMLRSGYGPVEEREAEVFATVACQRIGSKAIPATPPTDDDRELFHRIVSALTGRSGMA